MPNSYDKAYLAAQETGERLDFMFNPKEVEIGKSASWRESRSRGARSAPVQEFVGTKARRISMELVFDGWEDGSGDVSNRIETLFGWTCPTSDSMSNNRPQPPLVVLHWGSKSYFEVYVKDVKAKYTMFDSSGIPVRARVRLTLEEIPQEAANQNPTSGGTAGRRTYCMVQGDSLPSVAFREYRQPAFWRALAEVNSIDDPFRVAPGTTLLIPPRSEAARLS